MGRKKRTEQELQFASEHLLYEIWMLISLAKEISTHRIKDEVINNALLESFTIHSRAILDFLYSQNAKGDDVIAEDFFMTAEEWEAIRGIKPKSLENIHSRVGKEVAHLTYVRQSIPLEAKGWDYVEIANNISKIFDLFVLNVPKDYVCEKLRISPDHR